MTPISGLVAGHFALRFAFLLALPILVHEAYHWEWSRFPAWGYLEDPPIVAVLPAVGEALFSDRSKLALRFGSLLFGTGIILMTWSCARGIAASAGAHRGLGPCALLIALAMPVLFVPGFVLSTDAAYCFFQLVAIERFLAALDRGGLLRWLLVGAALGLALLTDLRSLLTALTFIAFVVCRRETRTTLRTAGPWWAAGIAIVVALPYILWNVEQGGAVLIAHGPGRFRIGASVARLGEYLFELIVAATPFLAVPLAMTLGRSSRRIAGEYRTAFAFLRAHACVVLGFFAIIGTVYEGHPNWAIAAFPSLAIAAAIRAASDGDAAEAAVHRQTRRAGWTLVACALAVLVTIPVLHRFDPPWLSGSFAKGLAQARQRMFGWEIVHARFEERLRELDLENPVRLTWDIEEAALLSLEHAGPPFVALKSRVRPYPKPGDAQVLYLDYASMIGRPGLLITDSGSLTVETLERTFDDVEELEPVVQEHRGEELSRHRVFRIGRIREWQKLER